MKPSDSISGSPESLNTLTDHELDRRFEEYLPKLIRLADNRIATRFRSKFDGNDIAGTVCRSVVRRCNEGQFKFDDDAEFWRLLVTIAKRKICNKVRDLTAKKRSIDKEVSEAAYAIISSPEPDPSESAAFEESLEILASRLDAQEKNIFTKRMEGREYHEIAEQLGVSERTVRRKMEVIRKHLEEFFDVPNPKAPQS